MFCMDVAVEGCLVGKSSAALVAGGVWTANVICGNVMVEICLGYINFVTDGAGRSTGDVMVQLEVMIKKLSSFKDFFTFRTSVE